MVAGDLVGRDHPVQFMSQINEQQFAEMLGEAYPKLWTLASAILRDRTMAEDAVQDAAITGLRKISDFEAGTNFTVWMGQIVRFTSLNYLRSKKRRKTTALDEHLLEEPQANKPTAPSVTKSGDLSEDQSDFDDAVTNAIQALEPEKRACLLLRTIHELSYKEIAQIVDIPKGTAMSHVHRAKATMRKSLQAKNVSNPLGTTNG